LKFWKYTSAGNDFVVFEEEFLAMKNLVPKLCDRRFGIGADGVLVYKESIAHDFEMIYFNADGGIAEMCGNGARALCHFAKSVKKKAKDHLVFGTSSGIYSAEFLTENTIKMLMSEVTRSNLSLEDLCPAGSGFYIVGVPHVVIDGLDFDKSFAQRVRNDIRFKNGSNVNFIKKLAENKFEVRTFERGVEAETLACGTGITAVGAFVIDRGLADSNVVEIIARGGEFIVEFQDGQYFLTGPTELIFSGEIREKV